MQIGMLIAIALLIFTIVRIATIRTRKNKSFPSRKELLKREQFINDLRKQNARIEKPENARDNFFRVQPMKRYDGKRMDNCQVLITDYPKK